MKLLVVFLLTVLPTLCFGLRCHFCEGNSMAACDENSFEDECLAGMVKLIPKLEGGPQASLAARASRTTGTQWCVKVGGVDSNAALARMCLSDDSIVDGCIELNEGRAMQCSCKHLDLCNNGGIPNQERKIFIIKPRPKPEPVIIYVPVPAGGTTPSSISGNGTSGNGTSGSGLSGRGKSKLTSFTKWVVLVGFLSPAYLLSDV